MAQRPSITDQFDPEQIYQIIEQYLSVVGRRQYIGARYVPIFGRVGEDSIEWDDSAPYEPLTIVMYQGNSYTSRQYVPIGIDINNDVFWAETGNYNAQIEAYRQEVLRFDGRITDLENVLPIVDFSQENTVHDYIDKKVKGHPKILAHRGLSTISSWIYSIDNSLWSFMGAFAAGYDGFECDVRRDANDVLVMLHDQNVDNISDKTGSINDLDYTTVHYKTRKIGSATTTPITTLVETAQIVKAFDGFAFVEVKESDISAQEVCDTMIECGLSYENFGIFMDGSPEWFNAALDVEGAKIGYHTEDFTATAAEMAALQAMCDAHNKPYNEVIVRTLQTRDLPTIKEYGFLSDYTGGFTIYNSFNMEYVDYSIAERMWNGEDDATTNFKGKPFRIFASVAAQYETLNEYLANAISSNLNCFFGRVAGSVLNTWLTAAGWKHTLGVANGAQIFGVIDGEFASGSIFVFRTQTVINFTYERSNQTLKINDGQSGYVGTITQTMLDDMLTSAKAGKPSSYDGYLASATATSILGVSNTNGCNVHVVSDTTLQSVEAIPVNTALKTIYVYKRASTDATPTVYTITGT